MSDERKIKVKKGRRKIFDLFVQDEEGKPQNLSTQSMIKVSIQTDSGCIVKYAPNSTGIDEIQKLDLKDADSGNFKIQFQSEVTTELAHDSGAAAIQAALNALHELSGVVVADTGLNSYDVSFEGNDGKREQALLIVVDSDLADGGSPITAEVTETTKGEEVSGIEVVEAVCGHLKVTLSTTDVSQLRVANDQSIDLYVRLGTEDLDIDPAFLNDVLDVEENICTVC